MGWFRRSAGRHSYGVPVVAAPAPSPARVAVAVPAVLPSATPVWPVRLMHERTSEEIGNKVAEVLWGYYGQQGAPGTPLTDASTPAAVSPAYDDAYADTLLATTPPPPPPAPRLLPPPAPTLPPPPPPAPRPAPALVPTLPPPPPPVDVAALAPPPPVAAAVTAPVLPSAPARYQVFERTAAAPPEAAPVAPAEHRPAHVKHQPAPPELPQPRGHVVQLGFLDGTTMDLGCDDPAAKALRAAAQALTLRV